MTFDFHGYDLEFIQKKKIKDESEHLYSFIYKFRSPITKLHYILTADYHNNDFFAVKFYPKSLKKSDYKYHIITNKGDVGNILITCLKIIPLLLQDYPRASFGFAGAPSYDKKSERLEKYDKNQRFNIYKYIAQLKIGSQTFQHYEYEEISGYLIVNRNCKGGIDIMEPLLRKMLSETYNNLPGDIIPPFLEN